MSTHTFDGFEVDTSSHCIYCGTRRTIAKSDFCGYECYHNQEHEKHIEYIKLCVNCALKDTIKCGVYNPTCICNLFIPEQNCPARRVTTMYDSCCFASSSMNSYHSYSNCNSHRYRDFTYINDVRNNDPERLGGYEKDLLPNITEKSIYNLINDDIFEPIKPLKRRLSVKILLAIINLIKWLCKI